MTIKTLNVGKGWLHYTGIGISFTGIMNKLRSAVEAHVPVGYQDESGFHRGVKPAGKEASFPSES